MKGKIIYFVLTAVFSLSVRNAFAGGNDIILMPVDTTFNDIPWRSLPFEPTASMNDGTLILDYPTPVESEVRILSEITHIAVYMDFFDYSTQVQINLSFLSTGSYILDVFAFDKWWRGKIVIEE